VFFYSGPIFNYIMWIHYDLNLVDLSILDSIPYASLRFRCARLVNERLVASCPASLWLPFGSRQAWYLFLLDEIYCRREVSGLRFHEDRLGYARLCDLCFAPLGLATKGRTQAVKVQLLKRVCFTIEEVSFAWKKKNTTTEKRSCTLKNVMLSTNYQ